MGFTKEQIKAVGETLGVMEYNLDSVRFLMDKLNDGRGELLRIYNNSRFGVSDSEPDYLQNQVFELAMSDEPISQDRVKFMLLAFTQAYKEAELKDENNRLGGDYGVESA